MQYRTVKQSPNYWVGRAGHKPVAIVLHIAQGLRDGVISWFQNPSAGVSAHFLVCKNGDIIQFVDTSDTAWGNGILNSPDMTNIHCARWATSGLNPNYESISIEHEGQTGEVLTDLQYKASIQLIKELCAQYNIVLDASNLLFHAQIDSVNRPNCPGKAFDKQRILADVQSYNPNVYGFSVGQGALAEIAKLHDVASSDELYSKFTDGKQRSLTWTFGSRLILFTENPPGTWTPTVYQKVR